MSEFDYVIFVNDAKEPIAGFAFKDDAIAWVLARRWGRRWKVEIRKSSESLWTLRADARGFIADLTKSDNCC